MKIGEMMTRDVQCTRPTASLMDAARQMKKLDIGCLPVCGDEERLIGMITDRDIVVRAVADGRDLEETKVQDVMTPDIQFCMENQPVEHAAHIMRERQIRRLVVLDGNRRLAGIVSLGDLAVDIGDEHVAGLALEGVSQPAAGPQR
jgi:CBS domain-containing protein